MRTLALDTSADVAVALVGADGVLAARRVAEQRRHAELLAPLIAEVLAEAGTDRTEVTDVVVGTGPAPFTGLRAGLVTARTLALALGVPVRGVPSLDALAARAFAADVAGPGREVLVATDARRREVYVARYRAEGADVVGPGPAVLRPEDVDVAGAVVVGPAAGMVTGAAGPAEGTGVDPVFLVALARLRAGRGQELPTEPLYLRRPDVTPAAGRKRATG